AQLRWLIAESPDLVRRAAHLLSCSSWIYLRLTGRAVLDASEAANPFLDATTQQYDGRLLDLFGLDKQATLLPPVVSGPDRIAPLHSAAAAALDLPTGAPVAPTPLYVVTT